MNHMSPRHLPNEYSEFARGTIVNIKLKQFLTYDEVEIKPGPYLNLVIGPNGSGKSTLVCAIAIGLGFSLRCLGRAKELKQFIKYNYDMAQVEITLSKGNGLVIVKRVIYQNNKSTWHLNGKHATAKEIKEYMVTLGIQLDNLCAFLPQDRVGDFSQMNAIELLRETQRIVDNGGSDSMLQMHERLIELSRTLKDSHTNTSHLKTIIANLKNQIAEYEPKMQQLKKKRKLEEDLLILRIAHLRTRSEMTRSELNKQNKLVEKINSRLEKVNSQIRLLNALISHKIEELDKIKQRAISSDVNIGKLESELNALIADCKLEYKKREEVRREITQLEKVKENESNFVNQLEHEKESLTVRLAKLEKEKSQKSVLNEISNKLDPIMRDRERNKDELDSLTNNFRTLQNNKERYRRDLDNFENTRLNLNSSNGIKKSLLQKRRMDDVLTAIDWLNKNKALFNNDIYGPLLMHLSLKNNRVVRQIETILSTSHLTVFSCLSKEDYDLFTKMLIDSDKAVGRHLRLHVVEFSNATPSRLEDFRPPLSVNELKKYGFEDYALNYLVGPPEVLRTLCHLAYVHAIPVATRSLSVDQEKLFESKFALHNIRQYATPDHMVNLARIKFGNKSTFSSRNFLRNPIWLINSASQDDINAVENGIKKCQYEIDRLTDETAEIQVKINDLNNKTNFLDSDIQNLNSQRDEFRKTQQEYCKVEYQLKQITDQIQMSQQKPSQVDAKRKAFLQEIDQSFESQNVKCHKMANNFQKLNSRRNERSEFTIKEFQLERDIAGIVQMRGSLRELIQRIQSAKISLKERHSELERLSEDLDSQILQETRGLDNKLLGKVDEYMSNYHDLESISLAVEKCKGKISLSYAEDNIQKEYDGLQKALKDNQAKLDSAEDDLDLREKEENTILDEWRPRLMHVVLRISQEFAKYFESIHSTGLIELNSGADPKDYSKWGLNIMVKFREEERLFHLDGQRQSGGEKSVSTIFFLMSLNVLTNAPFRVVDEINQGMDEKNERIVHNTIVSSSCENQADGRPPSQYFLVTPKLLPNLHYHERQTIICILNGEVGS